MTQLPNPTKLFSVSQASEFLSVSIDTLRRWDKKGKLVPIRTAGGSRRYHLNQLEAFKFSGGTSPDLSQMLTIKEAAQKFGVSAITLRRWDKAGKIKFVRDESNYRRISISEIKKFLGEDGETEQVGKVEKVERVENVESVNRQVNVQVTRYLLYAFAVASLIFLVTGIQLKSTPWGREFMNSLQGNVKNLSNVNQSASDQILGDEESSPSSYSLLPTAYSPNLLKNSSFETQGTVESLAFWQLHPNSTDDNTRMSNAASHSGGYSLLVTADTGGVVQESTKTEAGRSYALGTWLKMVKDGKDGNNPNNPNNPFRLHLALGPGYDKSFPIVSDGNWHWYSTSFDNPPPGLTPRIYVNVERRTLNADQRTTDNAQRTANNESFLFLDDAVFSEAESFAGVESKEYGGSGQLASAYSLLPTATYSSFLPTAGNVLSVSPQGIIYPTDSTQTQGGIGTESSRMGKMWGSNIDISQSLSVNEKIDISGKLTANGNITLGNNDGDKLEIGARIISDLVPDTTNSLSLGNSSLRWRQGFMDALTVTNNATIGGSLTITGGLTASGGSGLSVTGDLALDGDLDFQGPQNITTTSDNLTVSPTGNLVIDTSGGSVIVRDAAIDLTGQPTTISANTLSVVSSGTLALDTSSGNNQIRITTGTGSISVSSGAFTAGVASYTLNASSGAVTLRSSVDDINAILFQSTAGGIQLSTGSTDNGAIRLLSSGTITLETSQNNNNITVQTGTADFNVNNNQLIVDGNGSLTLAPSNSQVTVTGNVDVSSGLDVTGTTTLGDGGTTNYLSISNTGDLTMNGTANNIIANNDLVLRSGNSLTLDTSANNNNLVINTGSGTLNTSVGNYSLTANGESITVNGNVNRTVAGNITDRITGANNYVLRVGDAASDSDANGNDIYLAAQDQFSLIANRYSLTASGGPIDLIAQNGTLTLDTSTNNTDLRLQGGLGELRGDYGTVVMAAKNSLTLDTSANNTNLVLQGGTGGLTGNYGTINLTAVTDQTGAIALNSSRGGITLSTSSASGNGNLTLKSAGTLTLDTSSLNSNLRLQTGSGTLSASLGTATISTETGPISIVSRSSPINLITESTTNGPMYLSSTGTLTLDTSRTAASIFLQGGLVRVGSGGTVSSVSGSGSLYVQSNLEVDGDVYLGATTANNLTLTGQISSNLIPSVGSSYDVGSTTNRWSEGWFDTLTVTTLNSSANNITGITSNSFTIDTSNTSNDTEDISITFERGIPGTNSQFLWDASEKYFSLNAAFTISPDSDITTLSGENAILNVNDSYGGRRIATFSERGTPRAVIDSSGNILLYQGSNIETSAGTLTMRGYSGLTLTTSTATTGEIRVLGRGSLTLDTSALNAPIVFLPGTNNVGIGSTAPAYKLDVNGTGRFSGDLALDGDLDFTGSQNITTTADDLTLSPTGNLIVDTSGGTVSIRDAAIDLTNQPTTLSANTLTLRSTGTFILDTSANNTDLRLQAGSGSINLSSGATTISGNVNLNSGTLTLNGLTYTFPGIQSASGILTTNGSGLLSWGTVGAASITNDSLDLSEFKDELTLDADTSINGDQSLILRIGRGALQDSTGGNNDLQLSAEDKLILAGASFDLSTSSGAVDIISNQRLDLSAGGTLTLDTSANNSNILLKTGSGNINVSTGTLTVTGLIDIRDSTGTLALATDANGNVGVGTNAPTGILDILGQCVTGDTVLKRRRRRRKGRTLKGVAAGDGPEPKGRGRSDLDNFIWEDVRIDQIEAGDEILTLDETTGRMVVRRVNKLMNKGIKGIFELTTVSGKTIKTTGNHPYLMIPKQSKPRLAVFIDAANLEISAKKLAWKLHHRLLLRWLQRLDPNAYIGYYTVNPQTPAQHQFIMFLRRIGYTVVTKPLKIINTKNGTVRKADVDVDIAVDVMERQEQFDTLVLFSGDSDYQHLLRTLQAKGKRVVAISTKYSISRELIETADAFIDLNSLKNVACKARKSPSFATGDKSSLSTAEAIITRQAEFVKRGGRWTMVNQLKAGQMIAVTGKRGKAVYEEIAAISKLPAEQVFDIEVEGTHNFVGNGIVAHNTTGILMRAGASTPTLSSGTTSTTADIQLAAADRIDLFAGSMTLSTSSRTAGELRLTSSGSLILDTSGAAGGGAPIVMLGGNVGIGTTGPTTKVSIGGVASVLSFIGTAGGGSEGISYLDSGSVNRMAINFPGSDIVALSNRAANGVVQIRANTSTAGSGGEIVAAEFQDDRVLFNNGNLGIGTTSPGGILDVIGSSSVLMRAGQAALQVSGSATSTTADLQLAAADRIDLFAGSMRLSTSSLTAGDMVLASNGSMTFDTSGGTGKFAFVGGNVGIGTTGPGSKLEVQVPSGTANMATFSGLQAVNTGGHFLTFNGGTAGSTARGYVGFGKTGSGAATVFTGESADSFSIRAQGDLHLGGTGDNLAMTIKSGNIGLGTTSPAGLLDTYGDKSILLRAGTGAVSISGSAGSGADDIQLAAEDRIDIFASSFNLTTSNTSDGSLKLTSYGNLTLDTSQNNGNIIFNTGTGGITQNLGTYTVNATTDQIGAIALNATRGGITLSSSQASSNGNIFIKSAGTLQLDTSAKNANILLMPGSGSVGIGITGPASWAKLDVSGDIHSSAQITADTNFRVRASGVEKVIIHGASDSYFNGGNIGIGSASPQGILDVVGDYSIIMRAGLGAVQNSTSGNNDIQLAAEDRLDLFATSYSLTTSGNSIDMLSGGRIDLSAKGNLTLDTSQNNTNILMKTGSGNINVSTGTLTMTGVLDVRDSTGTLGLVVDSTGNVGIGTTAPRQTLELAVPNSSSVIPVTSLVIGGQNQGRTSGGAGSEMVRNQILFSAWRDVVQDSVGAKIAAITYDRGAGLYSGTKTDLAFFYGPDYASGDNTREGMRLTNTGNIGIASTSPAGILDIGTSAAGILLRAGQPGITISSSSAGNTADIQLAAPDRIDMFASSFNLTTSNTSDGSLKLTSYGNLTLDTSQNNGNIIFNTGTGGITQNLGTYTVNATTDQIGAIALNATRGGITLSSSQASSNGNIFIKSAGTLQLDTSAKNSHIILMPGTGNVGIGTTGPGYPLEVIGGATISRYASDATGVSFTARRARGTADSLQSLVGSDISGQLLLQGHDGSNWRDLGSVKSIIESTVGGLNGGLGFSTKTATGSLTEQMRIAATGNVGIGTTSPLYTLDVSGGTRVIGDAGVLLRAGRSSINLSSSTTSTTADLQLAAADRIDLFASTFSLSTSSLSAGELKLTSKGSLILDTSGAAGGGAPIVMLGGNVGVGTTAPGATLDINGATQNALVLQVTDGTTDLFVSPNLGNDAYNPLSVSGDIGIIFREGSANSGGGLVIAPHDSTEMGIRLYTDGGTSMTTVIMGGNLGIASTSPAGILDIGTSSKGILLRAGEPGITISSSSAGNTADIQIAAPDRIDMFASSFNLTTSNTSDGSLKLTSYGNLTLDTSQNNGNIIFNTGTGGITQNLGTYTVNAATDQIGAIALNATRGGITLSTSNASSNGNLYLKSAGTLQLDTSAKNSHIVLMPGTGNVGIGTTGPLYKLDVNGTVRLTAGNDIVLGTAGTAGTQLIRTPQNGGAIQFRNDGGTANRYVALGQVDSNGAFTDWLRVNDGGNVGIGTTSPQGILDVVGDYSIIMRAGLGAVQNSTSGNNDIQLAAEDRMDLLATSYSLTTSGNSIDMLSGGRIDLSAKGNLTLDTSQNNTNILMTTGSGNINVSTGTLTMTGGLDVRDSTGTLGLVVDSTGNVGIGTTSPGYKLDVEGNISALPTASGGYFADDNVGNQLFSLTRQTNGLSITSYDFIGFADSKTSPSTSYSMYIDGGNVGIGTTSPLGLLDTYGDKSILLRAGTGAVSISGGAGAGADDIQLAAEDQIDLFASRFSLTTSSTTAGDMVLASKGSMTFDTSGGTGKFAFVGGNVGIGTTAPGAKLHISNGDIKIDTDNNKFIGSSQTTGTWFDGTGNYSLALQSGSGIGITIDSNNDGTTSKFFVGNNATDPDSATQLFTILESGNVGIGNTVPLATLDTVGNNGIILRAGQSALDLSSSTTSTTADLQLAAADKVNIFASTFALTTSSASAGDIKIDSAGTLTLSTSRNNTDIVLMPGSGTLTLSSKVSTGTGADTGALFWFDQLSTGTGFTLSSSSTAFSTGNLALMDWSPQNPTVATGDLLRLNIGSNGDIGNLLNILDNGSSLFSVSESAITLGLPTSFTSSGDVSMAYDLNFTNPTASYIKSIAPLYLQSGEIFNSSDLTLGTYNYGELVADAQGGVQLLTQRGMITLSTGAGNGNGNLILKSGGTLTLDTTSSDTGIDILAGDNTSTSLRLRSDRGGIDISTGAANGSGDLRLRSGGTMQLDTSATNSNILLLTGTGNVGVGTTGPTAKLTISEVTNEGKQLLLKQSNGDHGWVIGDSMDDGYLRFFRRLGGSDSEKITIDTSGNLGIGTTSPTGILDILGQCVTGDTVLKRRRRRKGRTLKGGAAGDGPEPKGRGRSDLDSFDDFEDVRIDEIEPGDEILSLDEHTGRFVWQKVNKLMDKGIKQTYILLTSGGKNIRATAQHPYFVREHVSRSLRGGIFEVDQSGRIEQMERKTVVALAYNSVGFALRISKTLKSSLRNRGESKKLFGPRVFAQSIVAILNKAHLIPSQLIIDLEYPSHEALIVEIIKQYSDEIDIHFRSIGKSSPAHLVAYTTASKYPKYQKMAVIPFEGTVATFIQEFTRIPAAHDQTDLLYHSPIDLSSGSPRWLKVHQLKAGWEVATVDGWEKIVAIKPVAQEQVYDIEVEGTHNFVGNGIVAHNTTGILMRAGAASLQLSSSATSTTADIELAAADRIDLFAGSMTLSTSSRTAGELRLTSSGSLILDTSGAAGGGAPIVMLGGNVGIGTTSPGAKLHIADSSVATANNLFIQGNAVTADANKYSGIQFGRYGSATQGFVGIWGDSRSDRDEIFIGGGAGSQTAATAIRFYTGTQGATVGTEQVTINSSGNLGIASTSPAGILDIGTSAAGILLRAGQPGITISSSSAGNTADIQLAAPDQIDLFSSRLSLTTSSASAGDIKISSAGTLTLDSSRNNTNILLLPGSGNVGIGTTGPLYKLHLYAEDGNNVEERIQSANAAGDPTLILTTDTTNWYMGIDNSDSDKLMFGNATPYAGVGSGTNVTIQKDGNLGIGSTSPAGILDIGTSAAGILLRAGQPGITISSSSAGNTADIQLAAPDQIDLFASRLSLTTSSTTAGELKLTSKGSLILDTSGAAGGGAPIVMLGGNVGIGTTAPGAKLAILGTHATPTDLLELGTSGTTAGESTGIVFSQAATLVARVRALDDDSGRVSLRFDTYNSSSLSEKMVITGPGNLGIGTTSPQGILDVVGDYSIIMRAGLGAVQNSTSGNNDIQLAAEDRIDLFATSYSLTTSGNSIDMLSGGRIDLSAKGNLTLDTSQNNTNILLLPGSGNVGIGTTAPAMKFDVQYTDETKAFRSYNTNPGVNAGKITIQSATGDYDYLVWQGQNYSWTAGLYSENKFKIGTAIDSPFLTIDSNGNLGIGTTSPGGILDVIGNASVLLRAGQSSLQLSGSATSTTADIQLAAADQIDLFASRLSLTTSSTTAGELKLTSKGSLTLDTSGAAGGGAPIVMLGGNVGIGTTAPSTELDIYSSANSAMIELDTNVGSGRNFGIISDSTGYFGIRDEDASGAVRLAINSSGNVGIGTTSPGGLLDVKGDSSILLRAGTGAVSISGSAGAGTDDIQLAAEDKIDLFASSLRLSTSSTTAGDMVLSSNGSMTFDTSGGTGKFAFVGGNVGVGTTAPIAKLDITMAATSSIALNIAQSGTGTSYGVDVNITGAGTSNRAYYARATGATSNYSFYGNGGVLYNADNVGIGTTSPGGLLDVKGDSSILLRAGTGAISISGSAGAGTDDIQLAAEDRIDLFAGSLSLQTSSQTAGELKLMSKGSLILDTSGAAGGGAPIVMLGGNVGIGTTGPLGKLDIQGDSGILLKAGAAAISLSSGTTSSSDLQLAAADRIDLFAGSMRLSTSSLTAGDMVLSSKGSMTFDTSGGTGKFAFVGGNVGIGTTGPAGTLHVVSASGVAYVGRFQATDTTALLEVKAAGTTNPADIDLISTYGTADKKNWNFQSSGTDGSFRIGQLNDARNAITSRLQIGTTGGVHVGSTVSDPGAGALTIEGNVGIGTTNPLYTLDVSGGTRVIGDAGVLLRAGRSSIDLSSGTTSSSDLQLAAADRIDLFAGSLSLQTSSTSAGNLKIISKGSLILDTSSSLGGSAPIIMNGNVGIGTTGPGAPLEIWHATLPKVSLGGAGSSDRAYLQNSISGGLTTLYSGDPIVFSVGGEKVRITTAGNVGIGTTGPVRPLHIASTGSTQIDLAMTNSTTGHLVTDGMDFQLSGVDMYYINRENGAQRFYNNGSEWMTILSGGTVGIGNNAPEFKLVVAGTTYLTLETSGTTNGVVCHDGDTTTLLYDCDAGPFTDYAEIYPTANDVDYGEIVSTSNVLVETNYTMTDSAGNNLPAEKRQVSKLVKSSSPYQSNIIGITSRNYSDFTSTGQGSVKDEDHPMPVALNGRVPVKIAPDSEAVEAGDFLTPSATHPGMAMKATKAGYTVGKALESWVSDKGQGLRAEGQAKTTIMVFVNISYYMGSMTADGYIDTMTSTRDVSTQDKQDYNGIEQEGLPAVSGEIATSSATPRNDEISALAQRVTQLEDLVAIITGSGTLSTSTLSPQPLALSPLTLSGSYMDSEVNLGGGLISPLAETKLTLDVSTDTVQILGNTAIGGNLTVGTTMIGEDGSINGLGCDLSSRGSGATVGILDEIATDSASPRNDIQCTSLRFQPLALGNIEFLGGKIVMTKTGDVEIKGNLTVAGDVVVGGTVAGTKIEILEDPVSLTSPTSPTFASIGEATIKTGEKSVTIYSTAVGINSKVFVTADRPAAIGARVNGKGQFTIELGQPAEIQLKINWWIIN